jgi:hypothetical protein
MSANVGTLNATERPAEYEAVHAANQHAHHAAVIATDRTSFGAANI